ncbi:hypothetical protein NKR23_g7416 [Pleurostoma richardsiae]|uniref:Luciferase domain-containing protein n=1 Tax=Pleurostoma richardsiae TaxID=41990 RepID=A0AA38RBC2_9PEZI|nr:hypothetical protein NKR23_g7416 [Pleurostoma richardsiae]
MSIVIASETEALPPPPTRSESMGGEKEKGSSSDGLAINMVIRQDPFSITLDASALLALSLLLIAGMHFFQRLLLEGLILAVPILLLIRNDYENFLRLGPGGTPPTPAGYARLTWYRLFTLRDPFTPPPKDKDVSPSAGILQQQDLPYRPGPRPTVAGLAPQRQLNQAGSVPCFDATKRALGELAARDPNKFGTATSCLEKHGFALFARHPVNVCGNGEVCHIHNSDKSMHMNLHPDDIKEVLQKGWGQRHPMAWTGWVHTPVPSTFVMVYAPRDETDLRIVAKIIESAIWYTLEERVDLESLIKL